MYTHILTRKGMVSNEVGNEDKKRSKERVSGTSFENLNYDHPEFVCNWDSVTVSQLRNGGSSSLCNVRSNSEAH
jgi:hypothetical protein